MSLIRADRLSLWIGLNSWETGVVWAMSLMPVHAHSCRLESRPNPNKWGGDGVSHTHKKASILCLNYFFPKFWTETCWKRWVFFHFHQVVKSVPLLDTNGYKLGLKFTLCVSNERKRHLKERFSSLIRSGPISNLLKLNTFTPKIWPTLRVARPSRTGGEPSCICQPQLAILTLKPMKFEKST